MISRRSVFWFCHRVSIRTFCDDVIRRKPLSMRASGAFTPCEHSRFKSHRTTWKRNMTIATGCFFCYYVCLLESSQGGRRRRSRPRPRGDRDEEREQRRTRRDERDEEREQRRTRRERDRSDRAGATVRNPRCEDASSASSRLSSASSSLPLLFPHRSRWTLAEGTTS